MKTRPIIKLAPTQTDWLLETLALAVLVVCIGLTFFAWSHLPDTISTHFNLQGDVDGHGTKNTVLFLIPVIIGMYLLLSITGLFPHKFNYLVEITEANAARQYKMASTMMRLLKLEIMVLFSSLEFCMIYSATSNQLGGLTFMLLAVNLAVIIGTMSVYIARSQKER